jgi:transposase InsO family protein
MTSTQLRKLNAYPEFQTNEGIRSVYDYRRSLQNQEPPVFPAGMNERQRRRFAQKFNNDFVANLVYNRNEVRLVHRVYYRPRVVEQLPNGVNVAQNRINLEVVDPNQKTEKMRDIYLNARKGLGIGINKFYYQVCMKYLGITRQDATQFLKTQGDYNISRPVRKAVSRPIIATSPNQRWGMDTINMTNYAYGSNPPIAGYPNTFYKYILVVVDYFSSKVWARKLVNMTAVGVRNRFREICEQAQTTPKILQTDNGTEFRGIFTEYINQFNREHPQEQIERVFSLPYSPTTQGKVERMNGELRRKIKEGFIRNNNLNWVDHLEEYVDNINNQRHGTTQYTPNELWSPGYHPPPNRIRPADLNIRPNDHSSLNDIRKAVQVRAIKHANQQVEQDRNETIFHVGDLVRVKLSALSVEMRKRDKAGLQKKLTAINYSIQVYEVIGVFPPKRIANLNVVRRSYAIATYGENPQVVMRGIAPRRFYSSELLRINDPNQPATVPTENRARQINRFIPFE